MNRRSVATFSRLALASSLVAATALADDSRTGAGAVAMRLDGVDGGPVHAAPAGEGAARTLTISTETPMAPVLGLVRAFLDGKGPSKNTIVLSTDAVLQTAKDARLSTVRLPSFAGGSPDVVLAFDAPKFATAPSLRTASDRVRPAGKKLAGFHLAIGDLPTTEATRLDSLVFKTKDGGLIPQAIVFDVPSKDAPPFLAWLKKARGADAAVEYVGVLGETLFAVKLTTCLPSSVKLDGPVSHVSMTCARAR